MKTEEKTRDSLKSQEKVSILRKKNKGRSREQEREMDRNRKNSQAHQQMKSAVTFLWL